MAPYTFILRKDDEEWKAERVASEEGDLGDLPTEGSTYKMQRALYRIALNASSGGSVATTFSTISPTVAIYQARRRCSHLLVLSGPARQSTASALISCTGLCARCYVHPVVPTAEL
jgi:hypothetical protein